MPAAPTKSATRGFASMSPDRRRELAAKGGRGVPADQRAYAKDRALAIEAGRKGGSVSPGKRVAATTDHEDQGGAPC